MLLTTPLWRQTPPAVFPVCLGFMALALGWRSAVDVVPWVDEDLSNLLLAASTGYFLWFVGFYLAKLAARPAVLMEDLRTSPARAGIAAMAMSMMLVAAALLPFGISVPLVWWAGVFMQVIASAVVLFAIWKDPPEKRHFTPFQYLTFVGPVVGPIAGVPLGFIWESTLLIFTALAAYCIITFGFFVFIKRDPIPKPLRASAMIFLAPVCLFAIGFSTLGYEGLFSFFWVVGDLVLLMLICLLPWMMRGGYSPVWASFTFPLASWFNVQVLAFVKGYGLVAEVGTYLGMAVATPVVFLLMYRTVIAWVTGELAAKSQAATA